MKDLGNSSLKRRLQIVDLARKEGEVKVEALSALLGVSTVTIRNDLTYLEEQGYVVRAFGKARYNPALLNAVIAPAPADAALAGAGEAAVAQAALRWIDDGLSIFLGAGSLVHRVLPYLVARSNLVLTLHDLAMVPTARQFLQCEIHLTGGVLHSDEPGLVGPGAERGLLAHTVDLCLIEAAAIDARGRVLGRRAGAARLQQAAVRHAARTVVVAHSPDFTAEEGHPICQLADVDALVVNHDLEPAVFDLLAQHELRVDRKAGGLLEFARP